MQSPHCTRGFFRFFELSGGVAGIIGVMNILPIVTTPDEGTAARMLLALEEGILQRPDGLLLKLVGPGGLPAWAALAMADVLARRDARTRLATQAYSPMGPAELMLWLSGELRGIAPGAFAFLPEPQDHEVREREIGRELLVLESVMGSQISKAKDIANARVLERLSEYLPLGECFGKALGPEALRELGLLGDTIEDFLQEVDNPPAGKEPGSPSPMELNFRTHSGSTH